jgi:ubiquinone/menaquinone biosynthesis C-methylase UbiE
MFFLRKPNLERLPVAMSGVRMGERVLQIGVDDASLAGAIAARVGLSGHAAIAVSNERQAARARAGAAAAGALADVQITQAGLPFADEAFDAVVVHAVAVSQALDDRSAVLLSDSRRVLRSGGRIMVIERRRRGWFARARAATGADSSAVVQALTVAGFRAARVLAEREGYQFIEAVK